MSWAACVPSRTGAPARAASPTSAASCWACPPSPSPRRRRRPPLPRRPRAPADDGESRRRRRQVRIRLRCTFVAGCLPVRCAPIADIAQRRFRLRRVSPPDDPAPTPAPSPWRARVRALLRLALAVAVVLVLSRLVRAGDVERALDMVGRAGWPLALVLAPTLVAMSLDALGWRAILSTLGHAVPWRRMLELRLSVEALVLALPGVSVAGEAAKVALLRRRAGV